MYLEHHGIKGQRWGIRRFRNEDGSLTSAGKKRYENGGIVGKIKAIGQRRRERKEVARRLNNESINAGIKWETTKEGKELLKEFRKHDRAMMNYTGDDRTKEQSLSDRALAADRKMLTAEGRYVASHLVKTFGEQPVRDVLSRERNSWHLGEDFVESYAQEYASRHASY